MESFRLVASCEAVRALDLALEAELGLPSVELMEIAGAGAFILMSDLAESSERIIVVCGPGQNGGDGYVVARYAAAAGHDVRVHSPRGPAPGTAAARQRARLEAFELEPAGADLEALRRAVSDPAALVVDALFGTGLAFPLRPEAARWIEVLASSRAPVVSIDLPSGLDGDSGQAPGGCVRAARTLTIGAWKPGLLTPSGSSVAGEVKVVPLPYPPRLTKGLRRRTGE
jgi:NAD(P)H-hydrate epimerase